MQNNVKEFAEINLNSSFASGLKPLNSLFKTLDQLNQLLKSCLPHEIASTCHIGALDYDKETVVLFVAKQQSLHLIRNFSNIILQTFSQHNFNFQYLLIKVQKRQPVMPKLKKAELSLKQTEQLTKLALAIGKQDIIKPRLNQCKDSEEDEINF